MTEHNCPTCGTLCSVVGDTTLHYAPVADERLRAVEQERDRLLVLIATEPELSGSVRWFEAAMRWLGFSGPTWGLDYDKYRAELAERGRQLVEEGGKQE